MSSSVNVRSQDTTSPALKRLGSLSSLKLKHNLRLRNRESGENGSVQNCERWRAGQRFNFHDVILKINFFSWSLYPARYSSRFGRPYLIFERVFRRCVSERRLSQVRPVFSISLPISQLDVHITWR